MITVKPAHDRMRAFAGWATAHGVRTNSSVTFGVNERLIGEVPEDLLIGAELDGQPYVVEKTEARTEPRKKTTKPDAVTAPF